MNPALEIGRNYFGKRKKGRNIYELEERKILPLEDNDPFMD